MSPNDFDVIVAAIREFVDHEVIPKEDEIEETDSVPAFIRDEAAKMGPWGYALPRAYGGLGFEMVEEVRLCFEVGRTSPAFRSLFDTNNGIAGQTIANYGTEAQKQPCGVRKLDCAKRRVPSTDALPARIRGHLLGARGLDCLARHDREDSRRGHVALTQCS